MATSTWPYLYNFGRHTYRHETLPELSLGAWGLRRCETCGQLKHIDEIDCRDDGAVCTGCREQYLRDWGYR
jgi:hypothetical protein